MFFVLSGFLVSGLLFREFQRTGQIRLCHFLIRRGLKIYPAFYVLLVVYGLFEWRFGKISSPLGFLYEGLFLQNYLGGLWNHTWSLAVEEHFYLFAGVILTSLAFLNRLRAIPLLTVAFLVACLAMRIESARRGGSTLEPSHLRMDSLMVGVFLSYARTFHSDKLMNFVENHSLEILIASTVALSQLIVFEFDSFYMMTVGLTVNALAFGGILLSCLHREHWFTSLPVCRAMAFVGVDSYSIYLWHMFAKRTVSYVRKSYVDIPYLIEWALYSALAIGIGIVMARIIETPALRFRERVFPSRSGSWTIQRQQSTESFPKSAVVLRAPQL